MSMITQALYTLSTLPGIQPQAASESVVARKCIPENDTLSSALAPVFNKLTGALGGILVPSVGLIVVIAAIIGVFAVFRRRDASAFISMVIALGVILGVTIAAFLAIRGDGGVFGSLNNVC